jgi:hypothetical protein
MEYAFLLYLLLQLCIAESAVLETSVSNHTLARSIMFQSTAACPAACFVAAPAPIGGGRRWLRFFWGCRCCFRSRGRRQCRAAGAALARGSTALVLASWEGSCTEANSDKRAGQGLGSWTSPRAGFLEDVLLESCERIAEIYPKFVRGYGTASGTSIWTMFKGTTSRRGQKNGHPSRARSLVPRAASWYGIEFVENRCLSLNCAGKRGVLMKNGKFLDAIFVKSVLERPTIIAVH